MILSRRQVPAANDIFPINEWISLAQQNEPVRFIFPISSEEQCVTTQFIQIRPPSPPRLIHWAFHALLWLKSKQKERGGHWINKTKKNFFPTYASETCHAMNGPYIYDTPYMLYIRHITYKKKKSSALNLFSSTLRIHRDLAGWSEISKMT